MAKKNRVFRFTVRIAGDRFPSCLPDGVIGYQEVTYSEKAAGRPNFAASLLAYEREVMARFVYCEVAEVVEEG